jgi:hypothetical protein
VVLVIFATIYQQLENLLISPRLSARTMQLHPVVAFVAALVEGKIGGVPADFLALRSPHLSGVRFDAAHAPRGRGHRND